MFRKKHFCKHLFLCMAALICTILHAQQTNFIHIQSEANQPYAVQLNGITYSSSATGYIVIPQVPAGEHILIVGFPRNLFPEYSFICTIADKPRGFTLKQGLDNNWSLFDMVNFTIIKGTLSKELTQALPQSADPVITKPTENITVKPVDIQPVVKKEQATMTVPVSKIKKIFDKASSGGIDQVYVVINRGKADTVALFIPVLIEDTPKQAAGTHNNRERETKVDQVNGFLPPMVRQTKLSK